MSHIVEAVFLDGKYKFNEIEIVAAGLMGCGYGDVTDVANVLAANLDSFDHKYLTLNDDGTIAIVFSNFNDSYEDMLAALRGDDEDDDDDDDGGEGGYGVDYVLRPGD